LPREVATHVIRIFDPAREGFFRRMLRLVSVLAVLGMCGLVVAGAWAWRSERVRFGTAFLLSELRLHQASLYVCRELVRQHPTASWDYYRLQAKALRHLGRVEESLAVYDAAIAALPDSWWAHSHRCFYNALYADPRPVLDSCDRQLDLSPSAPDVAWDRRAIARARTGDRAGAIADMERALALMRELQVELWRVPVREAWLATLRAGGDPFTPAELAAERARY